MMKRLFWMTGLFLGLILLGLTSALLIQRHGHPPPDVVVLNSGSSLTYVVAHEGREIQQQVDLEMEWLEAMGVSPDGDWLYLRQVPPHNGEPSVLRIGLDGLQLNRLPIEAPTSQIFFSADGQWMIYKAYHVLRATDSLLIATADGRPVQNFTPDTTTTINIDTYTPPVISPEKDWIAFAGWDTPYHLYRFDTASNQFTSLLASDHLLNLQGHIRNASGDWLLFSEPSQIYRIRADGSGLTTVLPGYRVDQWNMFLWEDARLILMMVTDPGPILFAVNMDDFSLRWRLEHISLIRSPTQGPYILGSDADGAVYRIDGAGQTTPASALFANFPTYEFSPDGRSLLVIAGGHVYLAPATGGEPREVYHQATGNLVRLKWAEDGKSVIFMNTSTVGYGIWKVRLADGRSERLLAFNTRDQYLGMGRLKNESVDGFILLDMGMVLFASASIRLVRRKKS